MMIPFEVVPVQADNPNKPTRPPPPSTFVQAIDERKSLEITWPRVEGFILDVKERIRCDVAKIPALSIRPQIEPTEVVTKNQMGWVVGKTGLHMTSGQQELMTRDRFYEEHRLQRTKFEIARDVTEIRNSCGRLDRRDEASTTDREQPVRDGESDPVLPLGAIRTVPHTSARMEHSGATACGLL
jgi:hypothetical protein